MRGAAEPSEPAPQDHLGTASRHLEEQELPCKFVPTAVPDDRKIAHVDTVFMEE